MAGSLPFFPHLLIVSGEILKSSATSFIVIRSGRSASDTFDDDLLGTDIESIIKH